MADADAEAKAKAEKLAAAKKRVEQLKKKAKKAGTTAKREETVPEESKDGDEATIAESSKAEEVPKAQDEKPPSPAENETTALPAVQAESKHKARQPSLSVQSKMRSSSFRQATTGVPGPLSPPMLTPEGDTAPEIHRRQQAKIEELERDNRRLAKEASEGERRWKRAEEELEELREAEGERASKGDTKTSALPSDEVQQLKSQIAALERQNSHLQAAASRPSRHGASPSISHVHISPPSDLSAELASKSSTIESMELEISNLRAQLQRVASGSSVEKEQIAALEAKLGRTEKALETAQHELGDVKRNLERTTEKAVREGSSRTSAETKVRALERQVEEAGRENGELRGKVEGLEKKVAAMTTLHREQDARSQALKKEREKVDKESAEVRARVAGIENENLRLKEELEKIRKRNAQGVDDDGVDELESEARIGLEKTIRELEGEIFDLKRGVWREGRKGLEPSAASPGQQFTDIDLGASPGHRKRASSGTRGGFGEIINYGIHALTGGGGEHEELLEDEDDEFDEEAWRRAQEEEGRRQIERVKEIKRGLDRWRGWRMDLVEVRKGGGDRLGEVFEV